ncbi:solute carrier family 15 member 2 isoform X1 [Scyliorhinus canicula]|uniref:solute carrier family 15 member 2 isoform X1 n=2 Tax=Scyliorhinus canicula TaxID=7830 RepID=UPI0018F654A1|nr:solute carrier family 15 member 2 isoform X1 [Scyliorhinus canicula]
MVKNRIVSSPIDGEVQKDLPPLKKQSPKLCGSNYPLSILFVVVNEFCERFSFYGMKAVLTLYFTSFLHWNDDLSTAIYHAFSGLAYFTPVIGALIADSWLGKFKTIIILSIVYVIGHVVKSVGAIPIVGDQKMHVVLSMFGLFLIAVGTGGIKPCVAAFGGDQFEEEHAYERRRFFSFFYLSINAGSLLSTIITPMLRADVQCFGGDCYALAFGVPAGLMVVALVVFISGSSLYKKLPPQGNILVEVCKCVGFSMANRWRHRGKNFPKRNHWLDWAREKYPKQLIREVKMVTRVLFLYLPLPMFWALFDQQGSRWTLQATRMNSNFGGFIIQPDQMQTINALLIVTFIPIFDMGIYPLLRKCNIDLTPLKRMTVGMVLAAVAFVAAAVVENHVQRTVVPEPIAKESYLQFLNLADKNISATLQGHDGFPITMAPLQDPDNYVKLHLDSPSQLFSFDLQYGNVTTKCLQNTSEMEAYSIMLYNEGATLQCKLLEDEKLKPQKGKATVRIVNAYSEDMNVTLGELKFGTVNKNLGSSKYAIMDRGQYKAMCNVGTTKYAVDVGLIDFGAAYTIILYKKPGDASLTVWKTEDIKANVMHIAWQIPQYVLMSAGEVMFSITGVEFSYSQAPLNMKAVLQSGWLLTVAFGNVLVLIVAKTAYLEQWAEFVLFACLLLAVSIIFSIMAYFYTYVDSDELVKTDEDKEEEIPSPHKGFSLNTVSKQAKM